MNLASVPLAPLFLLLVLAALVFFVFAARFTIYRRRPCSLEDVAVLVRKVDVMELAALLDPLVPVKLRESLSPEDYRRELDTHIRLVRELVSRVNHNVHVIRNWVAGEYAQMSRKETKRPSLDEQLVVEALQTANSLCIYILVAEAKLRIWRALRMDRWPTQLLPSVPSLRVLYGIDLLVNYRRLTEITQVLSRNHGRVYQELCELL